jgi:putative hydrolase of the HAD superfamily
MKQVKEFYVSPIEQELSFKAWRRENDIKKILVDGDDTVWMMEPIFSKQIEECCDRLAKTGIFDKEGWNRELETINDRLFEAHGVNPKNWDLVVEEMGVFGLDHQTQSEAKDILAKIYQIPPQFIDETEKGLSFLKKTGVEFGIVTHANVEWTKLKFDTLGLDKFMSWEDVYIVDENGHKTKESWRAAMEYFKVKPENCLVVGNSPRSDINPVTELGVRHSFLVQNNYSLWSPHQQPVDKTKTRGIKSINDLRYLGQEIIHRKNTSIFSQY